MKTITKYFTDSQIANKLLWLGTHPQTPAERIHNVRGCARTPPQASAAYFVQIAVHDVVFAPRDASDDRSHSVQYWDVLGTPVVLASRTALGAGTMALVFRIASRAI